MLIEPITKAHNHRSFDSGDDDVNRFLRQQALQDHEKDLSRTVVLVDEETNRDIVVGYHTLLFTHVKQEDIPNDRPRIKRDIPVILLGQLGVDLDFQGRGFGRRLLTDAQSRVHEVSNNAGVRAMVLDTRTEELARWYEHHNFLRYPGRLRMFKSIAAIRRMDLI